MPRHLAILDLGSNSVKMLLAQLQADGGFVPLAEPNRVTRLARGVAAGGRLDETAMAETLAAIAAFLREIPPASTGDGLAVATSAVRDAANGPAFLEQVRQLLGPTAQPPRLLSGDDEAQGVFLGGTAGLPPDLRCACLDVGGGSTEIAAGTPQEGSRFRRSLQLGCVRHGERFALLGPDAPRPEQVAAARQAIRDTLAPTLGELHRDQAPACLIATGGTAATLGRVALALPDYDRQRLHGLRISRDRLAALLRQLLPLTLAERCRLPGMPADRAAVLPTGLLVLEQALELGAIPELRLSMQGLRWGLARRLLRGELPPTWRW